MDNARLSRVPYGHWFLRHPAISNMNGTQSAVIDNGAMRFMVLFDHLHVADRAMLSLHTKRHEKQPQELQHTYLDAEVTADIMKIDELALQAET